MTETRDYIEAVEGECPPALRAAGEGKLVPPAKFVLDNGQILL